MHQPCSSFPLGRWGLDCKPTSHFPGPAPPFCPGPPAPTRWFRPEMKSGSINLPPRPGLPRTWSNEWARGVCGAKPSLGEGVSGRLLRWGSPGAARQVSSSLGGSGRGRTVARPPFPRQTKSPGPGSLLPLPCCQSRGCPRTPCPSRRAASGWGRGAAKRPLRRGGGGGRGPGALSAAGGAEVNLAPGPAAPGPPAPALLGCNNHLKGEIKAPRARALCSRPHLMPRGPLRARRGRSFKGLAPARGRPVPAARRMDKGPFSVQWLAQSSRRAPPGAARDSPSLPRGAPPSPAPPGAPREQTGRSSPPGRPRTKFSTSQLQELERSFQEQRYIGASEKRRLSKVLNLSQTQIKTWFQNRRMKFKRQTQDARVEALFSGLFVPYHCYPEIQTSSYPHGMEFNIASSSSAAVPCVSLHTPMPSPALLLPPAPTQSIQAVVPSPALLLPPAPGFSSYPSAISPVSLTKDPNRLRFQPYLPSS
ncbi:homeobox protein MSX-1-like [Alligator mississippiensis]|uniref:homeobox protein MSX-1-like n=1 Tax=Alligator mississippiensis TaxID=8496 RepID=UPI0028773BB3|nr:homeobox protein MSX-1-like [Alligator mississippiensis]